MQKWKHGYRWKILRQKLKNEVGITLIELLAALSLLSVVILLAGSLHMFGQRHFMNQTDSAYRSNDLSYALTVISSDLRKKSMIDIKFTETDISVKEANDENFNDLATYYVDGNKLYRNTEVITDSVERMEVEYGGTYSIIITLYSSGPNISNKEYVTRITPRGGYRNAEN